MKTIATIAVIGGGLVAFLAYKEFSKAGGVAEKVATLGEGLTHPFEALAANFKSAKKLAKTYSGAGTGFSPDFQKYIDSNGGSEAYIKAHKAGTFKAAPFMPNSNAAITNNKQRMGRFKFVGI